jgi:hypothetical protein
VVYGKNDLTKSASAEFALLCTAVQVKAIEKQMEVLAGVPATLRALQATVDRLGTDQGQLRCEVSDHCSHASSLISQLQAPHLLPTCTVALPYMDHT